MQAKRFRVARTTRKYVTRVSESVDSQKAERTKNIIEQFTKNGRVLVPFIVSKCSYRWFLSTLKTARCSFAYCHSKRVVSTIHSMVLVQRFSGLPDFSMTTVSLLLCTHKACTSHPEKPGTKLNERTGKKNDDDDLDGKKKVLFAARLFIPFACRRCALHNAHTKENTGNP